MRQANEYRAPVIVTTPRGEPVVIMSLADYNALEETAYLTRSPENAKRLADAAARFNSGGGQGKDAFRRRG